MKKIAFIIACCGFMATNPVTLVYNMKLRRLITLGQEEHPRSKTHVTALPLIYTLDRHIVIPNFLYTGELVDIYDKRRIGGSLLFARYTTPKLFWAEITLGLEHEKVTMQGTTTLNDSLFGLDDIVLTFGKNRAYTRALQFSFYGLTGFPTQRKIEGRDGVEPLIGTRCFSAGGGTEISYSFYETDQHSTLARFQARCIHFFKRSWEPVLPSTTKVALGNITDILAAIRYRYKKSIAEVGYNPTFFTNQAFYGLPATFYMPHYVRQSVYMSFLQIIPHGPLGHFPVAIGGGLGRSWAKTYDTSIGLYWLSLSAEF